MNEPLTHEAIDGIRAVMEQHPEPEVEWFRVAGRLLDTLDWRDRHFTGIECSDGDVFPTVAEMYDHIRLVHLGIDVPDLTPPTGYWCCSHDWNRGTYRTTSECIETTERPNPQWTRVIGVSMNDLHEQGLIARAT